MCVCVCMTCNDTHFASLLKTSGSRPWALLRPTFSVYRKNIDMDSGEKICDGSWVCDFVIECHV